MSCQDRHFCHSNTDKSRCESVTRSSFGECGKDGEPIEDSAHETITIGSSAYTPWFVAGESAALTLELTQTAVRRVRGE
jgi:hypothetical protein